MTMATELFEQTMLSEAAYADFQSTDFTNDDRVRDKVKAKGFSEDQAQLLTDNYRLIHHQPDTASGFSATLFQSKADAGVYVLAIRGTAGGLDLLETDVLQIGANGAALSQIVDLYNYWNFLRAGPASGYQYQRAGLVPSVIPGIPVREPLVWQATKPADQFVLEEIGSLSVVGHSLGGHLAFAFDRLFSGAGADVMTVNGAGFRESDELDRFFDRLAGQVGTRFDGSGTNVHGTAGSEFVTQNGPVLFQQGAHVGVYTESTKGTLGHGVAQHTDSTAVMDLFLRLDARLAGGSLSSALARLNPIFEAASVDADISIHRADWRRVAGTNTAMPLWSRDRREASRWAS